jgi:succinyl-CoA synthetase beta subunit
VNIHEFQAKQLLAQHGVAVPAGGVADTPDKARAVAEKLFAAGQARVVVKSQIHAGGRGKGTFKNGLLGGVQVCASANEVFERAKAMLGQALVTNQTGPAGRIVHRLLVEAAAMVKEELYCAALLDRSAGWPVVMVSSEGGVDIEEVAAKSPEKIIKERVDPAVGMTPLQAHKLAAALGLNGDLAASAVELLFGVYRTWWDCDASLVEINPLCIVEMRDRWQAVCAVDAKISLDDNGLFRHLDIQAMHDLAEESPFEVEAGKQSVNYIKLDGNIACLVNGAGLAMATMDIIKHYGGEPANFLDVGGGASEGQVAAAFKIILKVPNVEGILVNIFGGIMDCDVIAKGIVAAAKEAIPLGGIPLVVRLEGNNVAASKKTLAESGLRLITADSMADAAQKVVKAVGSKALVPRG